MTPEEMATRIQALETPVQQLQAYRHRADANTRTRIHWIAQAYAQMHGGQDREANRESFDGIQHTILTEVHFD